MRSEGPGGVVISLQASCIVLVSIGVVIELAMGAQLGFLLITIGGLSFGVATKIHALEEKNKRRK